ncbi:MAG: hypothetical protein LAP40_07715 [Acidobacteriia bacterium]|nr:hypothetical protein [Terriglobia bacterium]
MSKQVTRKAVPARRRFLSLGNTMTFPRALRDTIPDLPTCLGRVLQVDTIRGDASNTRLLGPRVNLKVVVKETGKLKGEFVLRLDLEAAAARALAETLSQLADQAGKPTAS